MHPQIMPVGRPPYPDDNDRPAMRRLQNTWLSLPPTQALIKASGWDSSIWPGLTDVTFREVTRRLLPNWHEHMAEQILKERKICPITKPTTTSATSSG